MPGMEANRECAHQRYMLCRAKAQDILTYVIVIQGLYKQGSLNIGHARPGKYYISDVHTVPNPSLIHELIQKLQSSFTPVVSTAQH